MRLLHVTGAGAWADARRTGRALSAPRAGEFLHACTTSQLPGVLARAGAAGASGPGAPLVLLVLDVAACEEAGAEVRWVGAGGAGPFPHVHGAVPAAAVVAAIELVPGRDGPPGAPDPAVLAALGVLDAPPRGGPPTAWAACGGPTPAEARPSRPRGRRTSPRRGWCGPCGG